MAEKKRPRYTEEEYESLEVVLPLATLSFPHIFEMGEYKGKPTNFNGTFLIPKDADLTEVKKRIVRAKALRWGKNKNKWPKVASPIQDGDEMEDQEGYADHYVIKATSNKRPGVIDLKGKTVTDASLVYGGVKVRAVVQAAADQMPPRRKGEKPEPYVKFYLKGIKIVADGERLGGGGSSMKKLKEINEDEGSDDPDSYEDDEGGDEDSNSSMW